MRISVEWRNSRPSSNQIFAPVDLRLIYLVSHIQDDMPEAKNQRFKWKIHSGHLSSIHITSQIRIMGHMSNISSTTTDWYAIANTSMING